VEQHNLHRLLNIIRVTKWGRRVWDGNAAFVF